MIFDLLQRRRLSWALLALLAVSILAVQGISAVQPDGYYEWVMTPEAQNRTAAGECHEEGATVQEVCVQWCVITQEGHVLPQNRFECMPLFH